MRAAALAAAAAAAAAEAGASAAAAAAAAAAAVAGQDLAERMLQRISALVVVDVPTFTVLKTARLVHEAICRYISNSSSSSSSSSSSNT